LPRFIESLQLEDPSGNNPDILPRATNTLDFER
jgi:hypothetical protein